VAALGPFPLGPTRPAAPRKAQAFPGKFPGIPALPGLGDVFLKVLPVPAGLPNDPGKPSSGAAILRPQRRIQGADRGYSPRPSSRPMGSTEEGDAVPW